MIHTISFSRYARINFTADDMAQVRKFFSDAKDKNLSGQAIGLLDIFMVIMELDRAALADQLVIAFFWGFLLEETNASYTFAWRILSFVRKMSSIIGINVSGFRKLCGAKLEGECRKRYLAKSKNYLKIKYYEGWWAGFSGDEPLFIDLVAIHDHYGVDVCTVFFRRIRNYLRKYPRSSAISKNRSVTQLNRIITENFWDAKELELIQDPVEMHDFFSSAYDVERVRWKDKGNDPAVFVRDWSAMMLVVVDVFITHGLLPKKLYEFQFEAHTGFAGNNPFEKGGQDSKIVTLVSPIPAYITNEEAAQKLYNQINNDMSKFVRACEEARSEILGNLKRRLKAAADFSRLDLFSVASPQDREYMRLCKKWTDNPYFTDDDYQFECYYGVKKSYAYRSLGLLDSTTLLPFIYLIINEVPAITKSWLLNHEYVDKHGQEYGFKDELNAATGSKPRRGPAEAQQMVQLTPKARELFKEIQELTTEARAFLKTKNDRAYRYTLLSTSTGVTTPTRLKKILSMAAQKNCTSLLAMRIIDKFGADGPKMLGRFTPKSVRSTSAVIVYFRTNSVQAMSEVLGHQIYNPKLLDRYLPKAIRKYYLGRWIRIFQNGIIFESFQNSPYLLDVMDMNTLEELEQFIELHRLKPLPAQLNLKNWLPEDERTPSEMRTKGVIPVGYGISTLMVCIDHVVVQLEAAGHAVPSQLINWRGIAAFTRHAVELFITGDLEAISDEVARIFSEIKLSTALIAKIHQLIGFDTVESV